MVTASNNSELAEILFGSLRMLQNLFLKNDVENLIYKGLFTDSNRICYMRRCIPKILNTPSADVSLLGLCK